MTECYNYDGPSDYSAPRKTKLVERIKARVRGSSEHQGQNSNLSYAAMYDSGSSYSSDTSSSCDTSSSSSSDCSF